MQLFVPDFELPAAQVLLDPLQMLQRLKSLQNVAENATLSISAIRYKPNTSCLVSYKIIVNGVASFCHAKAFRKDDWSIRKQKLLGYEPHVLLEDQLALAMFKFPIDTDLPAIQLLTEHPPLFLSRLFFDSYKAQIPWSVSPLAYKPNRRYTVRVDTDSGESFVLKLHDASTFDQALRSAKTLKKSCFPVVPIRVGRSQRHQALMFQWIAGVDTDFATLDLGQCESKLESILDFLNRLHASKVPSKLQKAATGQPCDIESIARYLGLIYPPAAARSNKIACFILNNRPPMGRPGFVHGDFHEKQIIESADGIRVCDFDNFSVGDSSIDIANFVAHLKLRACQGELPCSVADFIDDRVKRHVMENGAGSLEQYRWHQIVCLFRLVTHPLRSGTEDWTLKIERILTNLERLVQEPQWKLDRDLACQPTAFLDSDRKDGEPGCRSEKRNEVLTSELQDDQSLSFVGTLLDPGIAQQAIMEEAPEVCRYIGDFEVREVLVRRIKPGRRCLIEFVLNTKTGIKSILGKASSKRLDQRSFETQTSLYDEHGFGPDCKDQVRVARPLGRLEPWKMWLQEKVPGVNAGDLLEANQLFAFIEQIAASIAKLHTCMLVPSRTHSVADELQNLENSLKRVASDRPEDEVRLQRIIRNCHEVAELIDESKKTPIHRDFYQDQILISGADSWLVDLDLVAFGHPALDVGNFIAHLTEHGIRKHGSPGQWTPTATEFKEGYLSLMQSVSAIEIEAFEALSLARHIFISWSRPDRNEFVDSLMDETERKIKSLIDKSPPSTVFLHPCLEY